MRRRGWLALTPLVAALASCGGPNADSDHRALWAGDVPKAATPVFGRAIVEAAQAMMAAAQRAKVDPKWVCNGGTASDLLGTKTEVKAELAPLGDAPKLMTAAIVVTFSSPAGAFDPREVPDYPGSGDANVFFQARASVSPDGSFAWTDLKAYLSALEDPAKDHTPMAKLVDALQGDLTRFIEGAVAEKCQVHLMTSDDLDHLPYELDPRERALVLAKLGVLAAELPRICKRVAMGRGPWELHVSHVEAVFRGGGQGAKLRSKVTLAGGAPCLGPVDVVAVGAM